MVPDALSYMFSIIRKFPYNVLLTSSFRTATGGTGKTSHSKGLAIDLQYLDNNLTVMHGEDSAACIVYDILRLESEFNLPENKYTVERTYKGATDLKEIEVQGSRPEVHANVRTKGPKDPTWNKTFHAHWDLNKPRAKSVGLGADGAFTVALLLQVDQPNKFGDYTQFTRKYQTYYNQGVK
jgi:hypothetical protein